MVVDPVTGPDVKYPLAVVITVKIIHIQYWLDSSSRQQGRVFKIFYCFIKVLYTTEIFSTEAQ